MVVIETEHKGFYTFYCPGCGCDHFINTNPAFGAVWQFNGNMEKPTVSPSLLVNPGKGNPTQPICHFFIKEGQLQYLNDCTHVLAGKTVDMEPVE